jgi:hypothetical protein
MSKCGLFVLSALRMLFKSPSFRFFEVIILKHRDVHHFRVARLFSPSAPEAASQKPRPGSPAGCCGHVHFHYTMFAASLQSASCYLFAIAAADDTHAGRAALARQ